MEGSDVSKFGGEHGIGPSFEVVFGERSLRSGRRELVGERVAWEGGLGSLVGRVVGRSGARGGLLMEEEGRGQLGDERRGQVNSSGSTNRKRRGPEVRDLMSTATVPVPLVARRAGASVGRSCLSEIRAAPVVVRR